MKKLNGFIALFGTAVVVWVYLLMTLAGRERSSISSNDYVEQLSLSVDQLEKQVKLDKEEVQRLKATINRVSASLSRPVQGNRIPPDAPMEERSQRWTEPIPVVVFACNRPGAVKRIVDRLIRFRPSKELFPITISQDCNNIPVQRAVAEFRDEVNYVKHKSAQEAKVVVPSAHSHYATYYYISRHYKLALEYIFDRIGHSSVILLEDDLDIAEDFFEYFSATRYLLDRDPMLWCVSAWNDNGKKENIDLSAVSLLYRSDFFPGLGWMMSRKLWEELKPKWPAGFWDDWLREPENRKGRQCIRPEVSRTMMTPMGKRGASKGQFFDKHLAKVVLSNASVSFTTMNLDYLLNPRYDTEFNRLVYNDSPLMAIDDAVSFSMQNSGSGRSIRVEYTGNIDYIRKADKLRVMHDFKAGVPRTAYRGIVSCFLNGVRIFLVPDRQFVKEYDKKWEVPSQYD